LSASKTATNREFRQKQKPQTAYVRQVHRASCGFLFLVTSSISRRFTVRLTLFWIR